MNVREVLGEGYIPTYTRTDITDALHEKLGFRTDYQIITKENMKKNIGISQKTEGSKSDAKKRYTKIS